MKGLCAYERLEVCLENLRRFEFRRVNILPLISLVLL